MCGVCQSVLNATMSMPKWGTEEMGKVLDSWVEANKSVSDDDDEPLGKRLTENSPKKKDAKRVKWSNEIESTSNGAVKKEYQFKTPLTRRSKVPEHILQQAQEARPPPLRNAPNFVSRRKLRFGHHKATQMTTFGSLKK